MLLKMKCESRWSRVCPTAGHRVCGAGRRECRARGGRVDVAAEEEPALPLTPLHRPLPPGAPAHLPQHQAAVNGLSPHRNPCPYRSAVTHPHHACPSSLQPPHMCSLGSAMGLLLPPLLPPLPHHLIRARTLPRAPAPQTTTSLLCSLRTQGLQQGAPGVLCSHHHPPLLLAEVPRPQNPASLPSPFPPTHPGLLASRLSVSVLPGHEVRLTWSWQF